MYIGAQLGPPERSLELEWAREVGDRTDNHEFEVPTGDSEDAYLGIQAFEVGAYGHEILVNDEPLSGFDVPPNDGWQYWVDTLTGTRLREGTNVLAIARDTETDDAFAVGTITIHWKEPIEE